MEGPDSAAEMKDVVEDVKKENMKTESVKDEVPSWYPFNVSYDPGLNRSFWKTNSPHN